MPGALEVAGHCSFYAAMPLAGLYPIRLPPTSGAGFSGELSQSSSSKSLLYFMKPPYFGALYPGGPIEAPPIFIPPKVFEFAFPSRFNFCWLLFSLLSIGFRL